MRFRRARSRGINVLRVLRFASPGCLERDRNGNEKGPPSLGVEAACHFLRQLGVDYASNALARTSGGVAYYPTLRPPERTQERDAPPREPDHSRHGGSLTRPQQRFPQERSMHTPSTRQHGRDGCAHTKNNLDGAGTASCAESWSAGCGRAPSAGAQTLVGVARLRGVSSPSNWVIHGVSGSSYHHRVSGNSEGEDAEGANNVDVDADEGRTMR